MMDVCGDCGCQIPVRSPSLCAPCQAKRYRITEQKTLFHCTARIAAKLARCNEIAKRQIDETDADTADITAEYHTGEDDSILADFVTRNGLRKGCGKDCEAAYLNNLNL